MHSIGTNGASLPKPSLSHQIPKTLQEERCTDNKDKEGVGLEAVVSVRRIRPMGVSLLNGPRGSVSPLNDLKTLDVGYPFGDGRSPFRPSPKSWANATTEALAHLRLSGLIPQVPEVPHSAPVRSIPTIVVTSPSPDSTSRVVEADFERVVSGVSLYSLTSTEKTALVPLSEQSQSHASSKPVRYYLPEPDSPTPSNRSTYRQTLERKQAHQNITFAIHPPLSRSDHSAEHEGNGDQKPAPSRVPAQPYRVEGDPGHSKTRQIVPLGDLVRYVPRSPIPGSIRDAPPRASHLSATQTNERQGWLIGYESGYIFPDPPPHRPALLCPVPQSTPPNRRRGMRVTFMEGDVQQL